MTLSSADVDAYFARIGWTGRVARDRATLAAIAAHHPRAIPFENLDPLLDRPVELAPAALVAKLVHGGRGGYCFEHNGLLKAVLEHLGFAVVPLAARVLWNQPDDAVTPRTHMLLRVDLAEGPVIVDAGFGGAVLTGLLELVPDVEQPTPHEPFRLLERGGEWRMQIRIGDAWRTTYRFDLTPQLEVDYELANWFTSTSPRSHFTRGLICARALPDRRLALRDGAFAVHPLGGETTRRLVASPREARELVAREFGIRIPDAAALEARLAALMAT